MLLSLVLSQPKFRNIIIFSHNRELTASALKYLSSHVVYSFAFTICRPNLCFLTIGETENRRTKIVAQTCPELHTLYILCVYICGRAEVQSGIHSHQ